MEQNDNRIPLEQFADFSRCTLYRDPAHPELGTTAALRYDAAMEAMSASLRERQEQRKQGIVPEHTPDVSTQVAIMGREPDHFGYPRSPVESSRPAWGGAIWPATIWRNGVGMPVEFVPPSLRAAAGFHPDLSVHPAFGG